MAPSLQHGHFQQSPAVRILDRRFALVERRIWHDDFGLSGLDALGFWSPKKKPSLMQSP